MKRQRTPTERYETSAEGYRHLPMSQGYRSLVDAALYDWLTTLKWHADVIHKGSKTHVRAKAHIPGRRTPISMHRLIMDAPPGVTVDHRNAGSGLMADGITIDNRRANLRLATNSQNSQNADAPATNTHGHKGVLQCKRTGRWLARIKTQAKGRQRPIYLGDFATKEEAALAYDQAARQIHDPEFIRPNFPDIERNDAGVRARIDRFLHKTAWVHNKSSIRYITWATALGRWLVVPRVDKKPIYVGSYKTLEEAKAALEEFNTAWQSGGDYKPARKPERRPTEQARSARPERPVVTRITKMHMQRALLLTAGSPLDVAQRRRAKRRA